MPGAGRLLRIVVVLELEAALEEDRPALAGRHLVTVVADDVHGAPERDPDGAWMGEPLLAVAVDEPVALGTGVVLVDHRPEPLDHLPLHRHRAGRGGVDDVAQRRHVVAGADVGRQLEQAHEHRRHDLRVGDLVALDELEELGGLEVLHHDDGRPEGVGGHAEAQRGGVVQRGGGEVHRLGGHAEEQLEHRQDRAGRGLQGLGAELPLDALRETSRARRVQHVGARDAPVERLRARRVDRRFVRFVPVDRAVEHQAQPSRRACGRRRRPPGRLWPTT